MADQNTRDEILAIFFELSSERPEGVPYSDVAVECRRRGVALRGDSGKRQRDYVYGVLLGTPGIERVAPGRFRPVA